MNRIVTALVALFLAVMLLSSTVFVVDQRHFALKFAFGRMVGDVIATPGLHVKLPPPFENVVLLDKRILTLETPDAAHFTTLEKKTILVDPLVKFQIVDPKRYYTSFGADENRARDSLARIVNQALSDDIVKRSVHDVVSGERAKLLGDVRARLVAEAAKVGVAIVDVRLQRVDYLEQINNAVYDRMKAERARAANELRSTGSAESEKIRADADRQRSVILAEAFRDAERIKGEGDAKASQIYAQAFGKNPEFYKFYRSLEAYRATFKNHGDVMVLDSGSDFFKYFRAPGAGGAAPAGKK